jgi:hypothetical protein
MNRGFATAQCGKALPYREQVLSEVLQRGSASLQVSTKVIPVWQSLTALESGRAAGAERELTFTSSLTLRSAHRYHPPVP